MNYQLYRCVCCTAPLGNIHVYTNRGTSYTHFYQPPPRRRRAYERAREEVVVEENHSQVSYIYSLAA